MPTMSHGPENSVIDPDTLQAYQQTEYRVLIEAPFALRIGEHSVALATLHVTHRSRSSAFMTACNPLGRRLSVSENDQRQSALAVDLEESGYVVLPGFGSDPSGQWPGEPSFLALDIGLDAARALGRQFEQNAIVWCGTDAIPQLVLLR